MTTFKEAVKKAGGPLALSRKTGIARSTLYRWLNGVTPKKPYRALMARALRVKESELWK